MEIVVTTLLIFITISVVVLLMGDLLKRFIRNKGGIFPVGVHILAGLLFLLGAFSSISSLERNYTLIHLISLPFALAAFVYAAGIFVVLRISEKRNMLHQLIKGLWRGKT